MHWSLKKNLFSFLIFAVGAMAMLTQVMNIREFMVVFYGNELVIGVILAMWLAGISLGALLGSSLTDRMVNPMNFLYPVILLFIVLQPINIAFIRSLRLIFDIPAGQLFSIGTTFFAALLFLAPIGGIVGFLFPVLVQLFRAEGTEDAVTIGKVYMLEALGALFGGALFTFQLIKNYNPFHIIGFMGICVVLPLAFLAVFDRKRSRRWTWGIISFAVLTILAHSIMTNVAHKIDKRTLDRRWNSLETGGKMLKSVDSKYQNIIISENEDQRSLFINCHFAGAFPQKYESAKTAHLAASAAEKTEKILIIGDGIGDILEHLALYNPDVIDYVTIDPLLAKTVKNYSKPAENKAVKYHYREGREFIKEAAGKGETYDIIILDIPEPETAALNRYYTVDFFSETLNILNENGIVFLNISAPPNYFHGNLGNYAGSIYKTLDGVFPYIVTAPENRISFIAYKNKPAQDITAEYLAEKYNARKIDTIYFHPVAFEQLMQKERVEQTVAALRGRETLRLNSDNRPVTYYLNLIVWDSYSGSHLKGLLKFLYKNGPVIIIPLVFLFSLAWFIFHAFRRQVYPVNNFLYIMFSTGAWSLAQSLILIFAYQSRFGYIYTDIGIMIGLFMFGIAAGTFIANTIITVKGYIRSIQSLIYTEAVILTIIALQLLLFGLDMAVAPAVFLFLIFLCGMGTGAQYPFLNRAMIEMEVPVGKTAGLVDSMDHLGAFLGALVTNIILVPVLGISATLITLMIMKLGGTVTLIFNSRVNS